MAYPSSAVDSGHEAGKIFVGGLSWDTTEDSMKKYFQQFGDVSDCIVMKEGNEGRPRGFGFVTFSDPASVNRVTSHGEHILDQKKVDPKPAQVKGNHSTQQTKKVFVGGLSFDTEEEHLRAFFESKGCPVHSVDMKKDQQHRKRGFAFVDFENAEDVEKTCQQRYYMIDLKKVEVKKAEPKNTKDKKNMPTSGNIGEMYPGGMVQSHPGTNYGFTSNEFGSRFTAGTQYNTGGTGAAYSPYPYNTPGYGDYTAGYNQHGNSGAVFHNYPANYSNRVYNGQQQIGAYSNETQYTQSRNGFPNTTTDSYSTGMYDNYNYTEQQGTIGGGGMQSYRMPDTTGASAHSRGGGGSAGYQSYANH